MDGKQGPDVALTDSVTVADLARMLAGIPAPASAAALIDETRELEDLKSALAARQAWDAAAPRSAEFTMPMDLAGVPALCLPCGFSADGLPYSLQFTGRRLSEAMLCRIAYAYEQATDWRFRHPKVG